TASPEDVWSVIGRFDLQWHPAVARARLIGEGLGQLRRLETPDGREIIERLAEVDDIKRSYRYTLISGVPASRYAGVIEVKSSASGSVAEWRVEFLTNNQSNTAVRTMVSRLIETGLGSLKARFGVPHDAARRA